MNISGLPNKRRSWRAALVVVLSLLTVICAPGHAQTIEYIHTDSLGSPIAVTDAARNVIERSEYSPYGGLLTPSIKDGPGFTGHVLDAATDLSYMQQRYYDPMLGRFLSIDPVSARRSPIKLFNRFFYASNNPYINKDPDGRATVGIGFNANAVAVGGVTGGFAITFSMSGADLSTFKIGVLGQGGFQAGMEIGTGISGNLLLNAEANSAEELAGDGMEVSAGGSINAFGGSVGYDKTICSGCSPTHTISAGLALRLPLELHVSGTWSGGDTLFGSDPDSKKPIVTVGPVENIPPPPPPTFPPPFADFDNPLK